MTGYKLLRTPWQEFRSGPQREFLEVPFGVSALILFSMTILMTATQKYRIHCIKNKKAYQ